MKQIITGLGKGAHLRRWAFNNLIEKDWHQHIILGDGFTIDTARARHFSGRCFKRNQAICLSFVLTTPKRRFLLRGDRGCSKHFAEIGAQFGPFDLAIVECGQYNESWNNIHLMPNKMVTAVKDLKATIVMPVHWGKFSLALHAWDEPVLHVTAAAKAANLPLITPMIGQKVNLDQPEFYNDWYTKVN